MWQKCRQCGVSVRPGRYCARCRQCKRRLSLTRPVYFVGCCSCPKEHRPKGTPFPVAGMSLSAGEPDAPALVKIDDPYA